MNICRFALLGLVTGHASTHLIAADIPPPVNLQVNKAVLCRKVESLAPIGPFADLQRIHTRPIALLVTVTGDQETLAWLRQNKRIPFKHVWIYSNSLTSIRDQEPIRAGQFDDLPKLEAEVVTAGRFDWRTTTNKINLRPGHYEIRIQMANGDPVPMPDGSPAIIHFDYQP